MLRLTFKVVIAILVSIAGCASQEQPSDHVRKQDIASDEASIRSQIAASEAAINRRDFAGVAAVHSPDGDSVIVDGAKSSGRDAIRRSIEAAWSGAPSTRQISIAVDCIRFLNSDVALADTTARFSEGAPAQDRGTWVMVRSNSAWRVAALRVFPAERQIVTR